MNLLILGGTKFVGRHLAEAALDRGWNVTLFHRGQTNPDILPDATHLNGDRLEDLSALAGREWDFCADTCAYFPRAIRLAGEALAGKVQRMAFVSTISVYADSEATRVGSPVATIDNPETEEVTGETYGALKALCESELQRIWGDKCWTVRPGIIAGPYDPTDRFTYWVDRVARFKAFVKPARLNQPVQAIDARALAEFILDGLVAGHRQTVNTVGPEAALDFDHLLKRIRRELRAEDYELLPRPEGVSLPLELPANRYEMFSIDPRPAVEMGLKLPGIRTTIRNTYEWWQTENRRPSMEQNNLGEVLRTTS
ncbi:MAG: hypothetical protein JNK63_00840 [Chthonomonas sp.]|nr:hypothetical protein [Chthonomonas sp.]